jgi:alkylated DNA repair dioxygenase AlkB
MFGHEVGQPRRLAFFSDHTVGYLYSGRVMQSQKMTGALSGLLIVVNKKFGSNYNGILVNCYEDREQYICAHSDSEKGLDKSQGVVSISYGAERDFVIQKRQQKKDVLGSFKTKHCHALQMKGNFQELLKHSIPKAKQFVSARYSFTFRAHDESFEKELRKKIEAQSKKRKLPT